MTNPSIITHSHLLNQMAFLHLAPVAVLLLVLAPNFSMVSSYSYSRKLASSLNPNQNLLTYHKGALLQGDIPVSILWYGDFTPSQKSILSDFLLSLSPSHHHNSPNSVSQWWDTIDRSYIHPSTNTHKNTHVLLSTQLSDTACSLGKSLTKAQIEKLAAQARPKSGGIAVVLTAADVAVEGFCMSSCGTHGSDRKTGSVYIWVGNSANQCPGQCAWPFHQPAYGPQTPPLVAPNGDVGVDGMVINLASLLAGAVTNPFGDGFFQGAKEAPLEAASACPGVYGKGAYPGYAGDLLVDPASGASYNANGVHGRKFLVPALFDPSTASCSSLV